jgi:hypothetical protein
LLRRARFSGRPLSNFEAKNESSCVSTATPPPRDGFAQSTPVLREQLGVAVSVLAQQPRRPFDVGEEERDGAGRKLSYPPIMKRARAAVDLWLFVDAPTGQTVLMTAVPGPEPTFPPTPPEPTFPPTPPEPTFPPDPLPDPQPPQPQPPDIPQPEPPPAPGPGT